jgi:hypothetical protein
MVYVQELEDRIDQHNWMSAELHTMHKSAIKQIGISFLCLSQIGTREEVFLEPKLYIPVYSSLYF